jgi:hypothetical protein
MVESYTFFITQQKRNLNAIAAWYDDDFPLQGKCYYLENGLQFFRFEDTTSKLLRSNITLTQKNCFPFLAEWPGENLCGIFIVDENVAPSGLYSADSLLHLSPGHQSSEYWVGFISPAIKKMGHVSRGGYNIECSNFKNLIILTR